MTNQVGPNDTVIQPAGEEDTGGEKKVEVPRVRECRYLVIKTRYGAGGLVGSNS